MFSFPSWLAVETVDRDEDKLTREDLEKEVSDGNNVISSFCSRKKLGLWELFLIQDAASPNMVVT